MTDTGQIEIEFEQAIEVYSQIIEKNPDGALAMLLVKEQGNNELSLYALTNVTDEVRPRVYIEQVAAHYSANGRVVEQMILQNEAWIHLQNTETGEYGLGECASFMLYHRDGTKKLAIIPFARLGDGTVNWQPRQEVDVDSIGGDVLDAMKEAMK